MQEYKPYINNTKNDFILGWYLDPNLCDNIVKEIIRQKITLVSQESDFRNYQHIALNNLSKTYFEEYGKNLNNLLNLYYEKFPIINEFKKLKVYSHPSNPSIPHFRVQKYAKGKHYSLLHYENPSLLYCYRVLVFMTYLNDIDEDGGGTEFPYQNLKTKAEKGLTLIWPASFTHPHVGIPSFKSEKYIITGWVVWDEFDHSIKVFQS